VPDSVSLKIHERIGRVFPIPKPLCGGIRAQDSFRLIQQWTNQLDVRVARRRIPPLHPGEPLAAAAAQQPEEEQFNLIIQVMRQRDDGESSPLGGTGQEIMTQRSRGHFQGKPLRDSQFPHVRPFYYRRQLELLRRPADQPFIRGAALATKLMVQMCHRESPAVL
jgi:hypothetical protein